MLRDAQGTISENDARIRRLIDEIKAKDDLITNLEAGKTKFESTTDDLIRKNDELTSNNKTLKDMEQSHLTLRSFLVELVPLDDRRDQM